MSWPARLLWIALACAGSLCGEFRAGASKTVVTPDLEKFGPVYMAGFGHNRVATGVHDDLHARCVAMAAAITPVVVCEVDSIGLFLDDVEKIRAGVRARFPKEDPKVVVAAEHDHESPDTMGLWGAALDKSGINDAYNAFVVDRVIEAAARAIEAMRPASLTLARARTPELDGFIHDNRPPVVHDSELVVLSLADGAGKTIATVVNWANHPETLGSKNTLLTADYPHYLCTRLEERLGGTAVLWNGAVGGMQSPLGAKVTDPATGAEAPDSSFRKAEIIGRRVADIAADAIRAAKPTAVDAIDFAETRIGIPVANAGFEMAAKADLYRGRKKFNADGTTHTLVGFIRLREQRKAVLEVALIPGELYPELSVGGVERYAGADFADAPVEPAIKSMMSAPYRMLIGLAGDEIGYIIPKAEWDEKPPYLQNAPRRWYGEVNSIGPEAAPRIADAMEKLIRSR